MLTSLLFTALAAQQFRAEVPLSGLGDPLATGKSFGLAYEPSGDLLYVAVCGDLPFVGTPNRAIAVIDPVTATVSGEIPCGFFPEEIAFAYDSLTGALLHGACTNSQSGTVTIWDASLTVVATVALPDPLGFGTCFPFGIAATDTHFLITTQDGSGDVHAISLATLALDPASARNVGAGRLGARCAVQAGALWIADSFGLPAFSGSEGGFLALDLTTGTAASWLVARDDSYILYPAGQDLAALPVGGAWLGGTDVGGRLWRVDVNGALNRALDLGARPVYGLATDSLGGLLAACTLYGGEVLLVDASAERLLSATAVANLGSGGHSQPNDAVFAHDRLYVSCQGSESLLVFDQLPSAGPPPAWSSALIVSATTPDPGAAVTATVISPASGACWLLGADSCADSGLAGLDLRLGPNPRVHLAGSGQISLTVTVPAGAGVSGRAWFLQGVVQASGGLLLATSPRAVVVQ
jgi:DNA-binding beta-propeller fold protein YncE